jgi:antagonist of KipI
MGATNGRTGTVSQAGFLTTVQDGGRAGFRRYGISGGGALDSHALRVANLLLENDRNAAGLEITLGGLRMRFDGPQLVAWCGGGFDVRIGGASLPPGRVGLVQAGEEVAFNHPKIGCRAWLAIAGGVNVAPVLESRATDLRAGFGGFDGRPLRSGDVVPLGRTAVSTVGGNPKIFSWSAPADWAMPAKSEPVLRFTRGSDWPRFTAAAQQALTSSAYAVTAESNRMGARLDGPLLWRIDQADLISEAVVPGTVQVPPNGRPILLLGDCQTIGGYPKIGHVITVDLPIAAQLCAGQQVRFHEISLTEAHRLFLEREAELSRFCVGVSLHH